MNLKEAIYARKSVRTFIDRELPMSAKEELLKQISLLNTMSELKIRLFENEKAAFGSMFKNYGFFTGANHYIAFYGKKDTPHLDELSGYYGEMLVLHAITLGLASCFVGGTFDRTFVAKHFEKDERCVMILLIGEEREKQTIRSKLIRGYVKRKTKPFEAFIETVDSIPEWLERGVNAVSLAPSASNRQGIKILYQNGQVSAYIQKPGYFDYADLGIAKANFEVEVENGRFELGNGGIFHLDSE